MPAIADLAASLATTGKDEAAQRIEALNGFTELVSGAELAALEAELIGLIPAVLRAAADKDKAVREASGAATKLFATKVNVNAAHLLLPLVLPFLDSAEKWQSTLAACVLIDDLAKGGPTQMARGLTEIMPVLSPVMCDNKKAVAKAAFDAMKSCCDAIDNRDIEPLISSVITAISDLSKVPECINKLAATTFVQTVDSPAMALIVPLLVRGFMDKKTAVKRQSAVIVANMSKLVEEPREAEPFLPKLLPALERASEEVSDPEARDTCTRALDQLKRIAEASHNAPPKAANPQALLAAAKEAAGGKGGVHVEYAANMAISLVECKEFDPSEWRRNVAPYLGLVKGVNATKATDALLDAARALADSSQEQQAEDDDAEELCNCKFTLAYGSKILLHNTVLQLKRGYRYGLLGGNDSGKTTLMRAIANEQVEGFPPASELRTVFVEADIQGELSELSNIDYMLADHRIQAAIKAGTASLESVEQTMESVGFTAKMRTNGVTTLSGGWRMKLALARAMIQRADILLLDEPTNHLDVINVAWVQNYLLSQTSVTSIIVSHDSGLLNNVCTHILQIEDLKLSLHKGNLSAYVEKRPSAKAFFELQASKFEFKFPQPTSIEGVKSKGKPLMKMDGVTFQYPGNDAPTISNITVRVSLASRVACVGVNGAGKSTMIKLLTGELIPGVGQVWKHPNARIAYVAQHAFHHIECHLEKTPNEYIQWRYQYGEDKETLDKVTLNVSEEEEKSMKKPILMPGEDNKGNPIQVKMVIEKLTGFRRNVKKTYEYEVKFENKDANHNAFVSIEKLLKVSPSFDKIIKIVDEKCVAREGMFKRPATAANVEQHLADVGLEAEFASHHRMSALSGGQKVKVVLAAAMWMQPHILILDEPTNYLDRESLGALAGAIRVFEGGVVMITHNNEFCSALCPETWVLENGLLDCRGDAEWMANVSKQEAKGQQITEMVDALGNEVELKAAPKKNMSRQEKKKAKKAKDARRKRGEMVSDSEDELGDWTPDE